MVTGDEDVTASPAVPDAAPHGDEDEAPATVREVTWVELEARTALDTSLADHLLLTMQKQAFGFAAPPPDDTQPSELGAILADVMRRLESGAP